MRKGRNAKSFNRVPPGFVIGRGNGKGVGAAQYVRIDEISAGPTGAFVAPGSGTGGIGIPAPGSNGQVLVVVAGAAAWSFATSITSVGTIASGIWQGTKIGLAYGGTNADLSATGGTIQVLKQTSVGAAVTVGQLSYSDISGTQPAGSIATDTDVTLTSPATYDGLRYDAGASRFYNINLSRWIDSLGNW